MRVLHEADMSPSGLKKLLDARKNKEARKKQQKSKKKQSKAYRKYQERVQDYKEKRQKWLEQQAEENKRRRESSSGGGEVISKTDADPTGTRKVISNVVSAVGGLAKIGGRAIASSLDKKRKKAEQAAEAKKKGDGDGPLSPPTGGGSSTPPPTPPPNSGGSTSPSGPVRPSIGNVSGPATNPKRVKYPKNPVRPSIGNVSGPATSPKRSTNEEYSCWREEFLYELKELRQKTKSKVTDKEPIIDIMKGKNKITMNPNVSESTKIPQDQFDRIVEVAKLLKEQAKIKMLKYAASQYPKMNEEMNSASHMAKATPRITGHDKSSSDKNKLKQPGKYSAEFVRDEMRKMFAGSRNYKLNSNLTNVNTDDNDVPKWTQDASTNSTSASSNESFDAYRHHGSGETTNVSNSSSEATARKKRATSAVLKAMAAMNKDVEPKAKKKKKKKNEQ